MDKKRIVHLIRADGWGGTERVLQSIIQETSGQFEHIIISSSAVEENARQQFPCPILEIANPYPDSDFGHTVSDIVERVQQTTPDLIVSWMPHCHKIGNRVSEATATPLIWSEHGARSLEEISSQSSRLTFLVNARASYTAPNAVVFCAERAREIHLEAGYNPANSTTINPGVDTNQFVRDEQKRAKFRGALGIGDDTPVIGFVARYSPEKDFPAFIKAARTLTEHAAETGQPVPHFLMCGYETDGNNKELAEMLRESGIEANTHLLGVCHNMPSVYSAMDIISSTSAIESYGLTCIEAMACGVPFVGFDVGDFRKMAGDSGIVVPCRNPSQSVAEWDEHSLVEAWENMAGRMRQPDTKQNMSNQTRAIAEQYDTKVIAARYSSVFDTAIAEGKSQSPAEVVFPANLLLHAHAR